MTMKVKCANCKEEFELKEEDVRLLSHIIRRYNNNPKAVDFIETLSVIKGYCRDNKRHVYIFHEDFTKEVSDIIQEYRGAIAANVARKEDLEKTANLIIEINEQIENLRSKLSELEKKKEYIISEMSAGGMLIENTILKFEKITGYKDMELWA